MDADDSNTDKMISTEAGLPTTNPERDPPPKLYDWLFSAWALFVGLTLFAIAWILSALSPVESWRRKITRTCARLLFKLSAIPIHRLGQAPGEQCIYVSNHCSYIDIPAVYSTLPTNFRFVAKRELTSNPITHFFFRRLGTQFIERFQPRAAIEDLEKIQQALNSGDSIFFFAEGTFRSTPGLLPFKAGAFVLAERFKLPIVPVSLKNTRVLMRDKRRWLRRVALTITIHPAIPTMTSTNIEQLKESARQTIAAGAEEFLL